MKRGLLIFTVSAVLAAGILFFAGCNLTSTPSASSGQEYLITYTDGGTQVYAEYVQRFGYATALPMQDKENYEFLYWEFNGEQYSFSKPVTDNMILNAKWQIKLYRVLFYCDGVRVFTRSFTAGTQKIDVPDVPQKEGYTGVWQDYTLENRDIAVNAIYTPVEYEVKFYYGDGVLSVQKYTVENKNVILPELPEIRGCELYWEDFELTVGEIYVYAIFKRVCYFAEFYIDGNLYETVSFPPETEFIDLPALPERKGYSAEWEDFSFGPHDIKVSAIYTPIVYHIRFYDVDELLQDIPFTVLTQSVEPPELKERYGYTADWEKFNLECRDIDVHSVYTAITYYVNFYDGDTLIERVPFTVETKGLTEPQIPKKQGYTSKWQSYVLECKDITVRAEYFAIPSFDKLKFTRIDGGYELAGADGECSYVYVPAEYNGLPVISVADDAFYENIYLDSIFFEGGVVTVGARAFAFCAYLSSVTLCDSVKIISRNAFTGCAFEEFYLPPSVSRIENFTFQQCEKLKSISVPDSVKSIGEGAFNRCVSLTEVYIGKGVGSIEQYAFRNCPLISVRFAEPDGWMHYDPDIKPSELAEPCDLSSTEKAAELLSYGGYIFFKRDN